MSMKNSKQPVNQSESEYLTKLTIYGHVNMDIVSYYNTLVCTYPGQTTDHPCQN